MIKIISLIFTLTGVYAMDYYSFEIHGKKCGYFQTENKNGIISMNAFFEMDKDEFENPFSVKYVGEKII